MIGSPHVLSDMDVRAGIQTVAQRLLGSSDKWTELVSLNNLVPPYLTLDPVKAYGQPLDKQALSATLAAGATQVALTAQQQLWAQGNNVVFAASGASGVISESQVIESYDGTTLTWLSGLRNSYPQGSFIATYAAQVFQAKVLMPGQVLYLPVTSSSFVLSQDGSQTDVFGTDAQAPLAWKDGDIAMVSGLPVLLQRIQAVLGAATGSMPQAPDFGNRFRFAFGAIPQSVEWQAYAREALLKLPEISQVTDLTLNQSGSQVYVSAKVWLYTNRTPLDLVNEPLTLPITQ